MRSRFSLGRTLGLCLALLLWLGAAARAQPPRPTVAVLYFDYAGKDEQLAVLRKGLAQILISDLSSGSVAESIRLVERDRLEEVLAELKLNQGPKIDPKAAVRVGKLLGAQYLVLGSYFDLMGVLRADARLVQVETGAVLQSVGASGKPGDFLSVEQRLQEDLHKALQTKLGLSPGAPPPGPVEAPKAPPPPPKVRTKAPAQLRLPTALRYARALDSLDKGDKAAAKTALQAVVKEQPDFKLAQNDLDRLML